MLPWIHVPNTTPIEGGICAAKGFTAAGICASVKPTNLTKRDLCLVKSDVLCDAAAVYTQNKVKGAPILVDQKNLADGKAQAIVANSGNANTCNADGEEKAWMMCELAGKALGIDAKDVIVASTGVIGQILPIEPIEQKLPKLANSMTKEGATDAAEAIMTTDTVKKEAACTFVLDGKTCTIGGMAKGSGMIHPNMATMLCFLTTDAAVDADVLQTALRKVVNDTFNMVSVDGDTSTNDTCTVMASGLAGNQKIDSTESEDYKAFENALYAVLMNLSRNIAADGEGASKLLECEVSGAATVTDAKILAKSVICSTLFKCAMFGKDANWGRILCAIGYAPADFQLDGVAVWLSSARGEVQVCEKGAGIDFSEEAAADILEEAEIRIVVKLSDGNASATAWGCDMTYDYVRINGDYRT